MTGALLVYSVGLLRTELVGLEGTTAELVEVYDLRVLERIHQLVLREARI